MDKLCAQVGDPWFDHELLWMGRTCVTSGHDWVKHELLYVHKSLLRGIVLWLNNSIPKYWSHIICVQDMCVAATSGNDFIM